MAIRIKKQITDELQEFFREAQGNCLYTVIVETTKVLDIHKFESYSDAENFYELVSGGEKTLAVFFDQEFNIIGHNLDEEGRI